MWYKASSVINAIKECQSLSIAEGFYDPSCPKQGNNILCHEYFPDCDGKYIKCSQSLRLNNNKGDIIIIYFNYYISKDNRDGRIKKMNSTLLLLFKKYNINENMLIGV